MKNKKINVMHIIHSFNQGGLEEIVVNLVNNFDPLSFNLSICSLKKGGILKKKINPGIKVFELDKREGNDPFITFKLMKLFKKENVHIVHAHNWGTMCEGGLGAKFARVPIIFHQEHGTIISVLKAKKKRIWAMKFFSQFVATQIIVVSETLRQAIINLLKIDESKIITIHNGVDLNKFNVQVDRKLKRQEIGIMDDDIIVGTIGRLVPVKNQKILIEAIKYLLNTIDKIKLIVIGEGPLRGELQSLAQNLNLEDKVLFLGYRNDIPELLKIMDIFILPSLHEGISITLLEAMASELPVVVTDVGGNPEIVINGETGILVPSNDYVKLAQAINDIIEDKNKAIYGQKAKKLIENKFNLKNVVKEYESLYKSFIEKVKKNN